MPTSSSSLQAARQRLGGQLRELRLAAGLSGRAFAAAAGCQASKVSQIEKAVRPASAADVRLWCRICGASPQQAEDLLTEQAAVARLWIAFRDLDRRTGLNATQKMLSGDMWERVRLFRTYQTKVVPGLLQTAGYMAEILTAVRVPKLGPGWGYRYEKFHRTAQAWATVGVAALVRRSNGSVAEARIGLTNMGPTPVRATAAESAAAGAEASRDALRAAAGRADEGTNPPGDLHGAPDYRRHLARVLTGRALAAAAGV